MKHDQKILGITVNCVIFLLVACPSAWLLDRELRAVKSALGVGREAKVETWYARMNETDDPWRKWKYCREILVLDPKNDRALFWKGKIAKEYAQKAQNLMSRNQTPEAITTLVLAVRVDPQISYLWVWMDNWIKDWTEKTRTTPSRPRAILNNNKLYTQYSLIVK